MVRKMIIPALVILFAHGCAGRCRGCGRRLQDTIEGGIAEETYPYAV